MLVKDLISHMHCTQVATISIQETYPDIKKSVIIDTIYKQDTQGSSENLSIPNDILNREVDYYYISPRIVKDKKVSDEYIELPYIELQLAFSIMLKREEEN